MHRINDTPAETDRTSETNARSECSRIPDVPGVDGTDPWACIYRCVYRGHQIHQSGPSRARKQQRYCDDRVAEQFFLVSQHELRTVTCVLCRNGACYNRSANPMVFTVIICTTRTPCADRMRRQLCWLDAQSRSIRIVTQVRHGSIMAKEKHPLT